MRDQTVETCFASVFAIAVFCAPAAALAAPAMTSNLIGLDRANTLVVTVADDEKEAMEEAMDEKKKPAGNPGDTSATGEDEIEEPMRKELEPDG